MCDGRGNPAAVSVAEVWQTALISHGASGRRRNWFERIAEDGNNMNVKTNMRMRFMLPFEGTVLHKDDSTSQITLPEAYECRVNILSENTTAQTFDLEVVGNGELLGDGDRIANVPFLVLAIHEEDVRRVARDCGKLKAAILGRGGGKWRMGEVNKEVRNAP